MGKLTRFLDWVAGREPEPDPAIHVRAAPLREGWHVPAMIPDTGPLELQMAAIIRMRTSCTQHVALSTARRLLHVPAVRDALFLVSQREAAASADRAARDSSNAR